MSLTASQLTPETALFRHVIPAGEPYLFEVKAGQTCACSTWKATRPWIRCSTAPPTRASATTRNATLRRQDKIYLTTGSVLYSNLGNPLLTIVADTCAAMTRWAAPAPRKATLCATRWASATCTAAATTSCAPACTTVGWTSAISAPTSTSS